MIKSKSLKFFLAVLCLLAQKGLTSCPDQDFGVYIDTLSPGVVNVVLYRYGPNSNVVWDKFNPDTTELSKWRNTFRFVEEKTVTETQLRTVIQEKSDSAKTIILASLDSLVLSKAQNSDSLMTAYWSAKQIYKGTLSKREFSVKSSLTYMPFYKRQGLMLLKGKQVILFLKTGADDLLTLPVAEQDGPCSYGSSSFVVEKGRVSRTGFYWLGLPGVSLDMATLWQGGVNVRSPRIASSRISIRPNENGLSILHLGQEKVDYRVLIFNAKGYVMDNFRLSPNAARVWAPAKKTAGIYHVEITSLPASKLHLKSEHQKILLW